jgi:hypothetical protein
LKTFSCSSRPNNAHLSAQHSKQHKDKKFEKHKKNRNAKKKQGENGEIRVTLFATISGYHISDYLCLLVVILLMAMNSYFIGVY